MKVLVTGGAGFIGGHLASAHLADGDEVVLLDDLSAGRVENVPAGARLELGDVSDPQVVDRCTQGTRIVYHLAAVASVQSCIENPLRAHEVNAGGTLRVLEACRKNGVEKLVLASTCAVYGNEPTLPKTETMPIEPVGPYSATKAAAEAYCRGWFESFGLRTTVLRFFNVYGPRQDPRSQYAAVVPRFVDAALAGEPLLVFGDGLQTRDFVHVDDVVRACRGVARRGEADGLVVNVASGRETSVLDLARTVLKATRSASRVQHMDAKPGEVRRSVADIDRLRRFLGAGSSTPLLRGIESVVDAASKG